MALRRSLDDYGLQRTETGFSTSLDPLVSLVPFLGTNTPEEWQFRRIHDPQLSPAVRNLHKYACSSQKKAFVVLEAFLEFGGDVRITEMRLWQMIVDSWTFSGNTVDSLRYVGFVDIINPTVIALMDEEWAHQLSLGQKELGTEAQRVLTITPETGKTWGQNPFIRCSMHVAASLSTAEKTVQCGKAYLINGRDTGRHMLLEFTSGDSSQLRDYREKEMHKVEEEEEQKHAAPAAGEEEEETIFLSPQTTPRAKQ